MRRLFAPGRNIAIKCPPHEFAALVAFYRDTVALPVLEDGSESVLFEFGPLRLWIDRTATLSQAETWLQLVTDDLDEAGRRLAGHGVARADGLEPLPGGFKGFWVLAPGNLVHLVAETGQDP